MSIAMRMKPLKVISLLGLLTIAGWLVITLAGAGFANAQVTSRTDPGIVSETPASGGSSNPLRITPYLHAIPAFTATDVQQFIKANGFIGGSTLPGRQIVIVKILFITSQQASVLLQGESTGLPADALVCYVQVRGPFSLTNWNPPIGVQGIPIIQTGDEVFDARTGNLLVWGTP